MSCQMDFSEIQQFELEFRDLASQLAGTSGLSKEVVFDIYSSEHQRNCEKHGLASCITDINVALELYAYISEIVVYIVKVCDILAPTFSDRFGADIKAENVISHVDARLRGTTD